MPYLGLHSYHGEGYSDVYDPGLRLGTLLGGRIGPSFSLSGELTFDFSNFSNVPSGVTTAEVAVDVAVSPLVHLPFGTGEVVVGPKLGFFGLGGSASNGIDMAEYSASGLVAGLNAGAFFAVSRDVALGGLLSFVLRDSRQFCDETPSGDEVCTDVDANAAKVLGFTAAAMF